MNDPKHFVTYHDVQYDGKNYIVEWTHSEDMDGHISITEASVSCSEDTELLEAYDFAEIE